MRRTSGDEGATGECCEEGKGEMENAGEMSKEDGR